MVGFLREVSTRDDVVPIKRPSAWQEVPEMAPILSMRQPPRRGDFLQDPSARIEISSLSDSPRTKELYSPSRSRPTPPVTIASHSGASRSGGGVSLPLMATCGSARAGQSHEKARLSPGHEEPVARQGHMGSRPSNRSEAACVASMLTARLHSKEGLTFRQELAAHDAAFKEVSRQVSVHCCERGALLDRLRAFYTQSTETTAQRAVQTVYREMEQHLLQLQGELLEARDEVKRITSGDGDSAEKTIRAVLQMTPMAQRDVLRRLMRDLGQVLLVSTPDGEALPPADQADALEQYIFSHHTERTTLNGALATSVARLGAIGQCNLIQTILQFDGGEEGSPISLLARTLGLEQRTDLLTSAFAAAPDADKGELLAELVRTLPQVRAHATLVDTLLALEACATTTQSAFLNAWVGGRRRLSTSAEDRHERSKGDGDYSGKEASALTQPAEHAIRGGEGRAAAAATAHTTNESVHPRQTELVAQLLASMDVESATMAIQMGTETWIPDRISRLTQSLQSAHARTSASQPS